MLASGELRSIELRDGELILHEKNVLGNYKRTWTVQIKDVRNVELDEPGLIAPGQITITHFGGKEKIPFSKQQKDLFRAFHASIVEALRNKNAGQPAVFTPPA